jgi:cytochrome c oxidase subunit 2
MQAPHLPPTWEGHESVLRPASEQAHTVLGLFHFQWVVATIVWVLVVAAVLYAAYRGSRRAVPDVRQEPTLRKWVSIATALTIVTLVIYLVYDFGVGRAVAAPFGDQTALHISLTGHQWWWEVTYNDTSPQHQLSTANEIHVPVGRRVLFTLTSRDVIHSFWMPNLSGKKDLIPGHTSDVWFVADTPGVYRGQCAEFCGLEHAKMALVVVAESPADYRKWYEAQLQPDAQPSDSLRAFGQQVFLTGACALCHAINGTPAGAHFGPDLTHFGSRMTLAAGTLPNTRGNLGGWIVDPQSIKPGVHMPSNNLDPKQLRALIAYLEGLQ